MVRNQNYLVDIGKQSWKGYTSDSVRQMSTRGCIFFKIQAFFYRQNKDDKNNDNNKKT